MTGIDHNAPNDNVASATKKAHSRLLAMAPVALSLFLIGMITPVMLAVFGVTFVANQQWLLGAAGLNFVGLYLVINFFVTLANRDAKRTRSTGFFAVIAAIVVTLVAFVTREFWFVGVSGWFISCLAILGTWLVLRQRDLVDVNIGRRLPGNPTFRTTLFVIGAAAALYAVFIYFFWGWSAVVQPETWNEFLSQETDITSRRNGDRTLSAGGAIIVAFYVSALLSWIFFYAYLVSHPNRKQADILAGDNGVVEGVVQPAVASDRMLRSLGVALLAWGIVGFAVSLAISVMAGTVGIETKLFYIAHYFVSIPLAIGLLTFRLIKNIHLFIFAIVGGGVFAIVLLTIDIIASILLGTEIVMPPS